MGYLDDLATQFYADADATDDPAKAVMYRLRAREAEEQSWLLVNLDDLTEQLLADADATNDPAEAVMYRLRARQAEDLSSYDRLRESPEAAGDLQTPVWKTPRDTEDFHHAVRFHWDKGGLMAVEIARTDGEALRLSDLRDSSVFPFRELIRRDRETHAERNRKFTTQASYYDDEGYTAFVEELRGRVEASRSPYPPEHWENVARIYSEAMASHDPAPVRRVAEELNVARSTARNWVAKCRKIGYLPPTEERKAKGNRT